MPQYQVPQFIDMEKKLIAFLTVRQVITLGINAAVLFILYFLLTGVIFTIAVVVFTSIAAALAFIKMNGRPIIDVLFSIAAYYLQPRIYIWGREENKPKRQSPKFLQNITKSKQEKPYIKKEDQEEAEKIPTHSEIEDLANLLNQ